MGVAGGRGSGSTGSCPQAILNRAFATTDVPLSRSDQVALLADERVACVVDSYEAKVRCVDAEGVVAGVFGRVGEGPGEFGIGSFDHLGWLDLVRGEAGHGRGV